MTNQEDSKLTVMYVIAGFVFFLMMLAALVEDNLANSDSPTIITFTGSVKRDDRFEKELPGGLLFYLEPEDVAELGWQGWRMDISSVDDSNANYAGVVTFPFRGLNMLQIYGSHFRNSDNTGPNDGSVNAPNYGRSFQFVDNGFDYQLARDALACTASYDCDGFADSNEAFDVHMSLFVNRGAMTITHIELGNLVPNEYASIEYMEFDVSLNFEELCFGEYFFSGHCPIELSDPDESDLNE